MSVQFHSYLVGIHKDDLVNSQGEQNIQEEYLISPDNTLLFSLLVQPAGPLVLN